MKKIKCPYCGKEPEWVPNEKIYGKRYGNSYMTYWCEPCDAYVGCHNNTRRPLGTMANKSLRQKRIFTHSVIDPFWKEGKYTRREMYRKLNAALGREVHVGESDLLQCQEIIDVARVIL